MNIDKKIELLKTKHNYYEDFKKYLMQQIFAQKLRFNFTDEWKKYLLGDISLIGKGFTPSTNNPSFWDGDYVWKGSVSVTDIKADIRFTAESNFAISTNFDNKLAEYFDEGDYFIYTLKRNDDNVILHQYKYTKNGGEEILDLVEEN